MTRLDWSKANWPNSDPARVIDVGIGWAPDDGVVQKRRKKKRKTTLKTIGKNQASNIASLIVPRSKAVLIASVFRDLGRSLPSKRNRLNNWLKRLIEQGIILENGDIVKDHPVILEWHAKIEKRSK